MSEEKEWNKIKSKQKAEAKLHFIDFLQHFFLHRIYNLSFLMVFQKQP